MTTPEMTELVFMPAVTVTFVDGEVQSTVIDWFDSYDEVASDMDPEAAEPLTWAFDQWLSEQGVLSPSHHHLFPEDD